MYVADWIDTSGYLTLPLDSFTWRTQNRPVTFDTTGQLVAHWAANETVHEGPFWAYATMRAATTNWTVDWLRPAQTVFFQPTETTALQKQLEDVTRKAIGSENTDTASDAEGILRAVSKRDEDTIQSNDDTALVAGSILLSAELNDSADCQTLQPIVADVCNIHESGVQRAVSQIEDALPRSFRSAAFEPAWMPAPARYGPSAKPIDVEQISDGEL